MSLKYGMYRNPKSTCKEGKQPLHPRVIVQQTISTSSLAQMIGQTTTMSSADTKGVLEALSEWMAFFLENGNNVRLDGIGTFSLSLQSRPVMDEKDITSVSVCLKNVNFRCSKELKERMRGITIERETNAGSKEIMPVEERKKRIVDYLSTYQSLTRTDCMRLNKCKKDLAIKDLNELIAEKKILRLGNGRTVLYVGY